MKLGNVSQTVYKRSILKQIQDTEEQRLVQPSGEEHCYGIETAPEELVLNAEVSLYGNEKDLCRFAILEATNDLAAKGATAKGVFVQLMLPDYAFESRIKAMIACAKETAEHLGMEILNANAQIVPNISTTIVHVTALGTVSRENYRQMSASAEQELVLLGYMGLSGALRVKREKEEELRTRFASGFLDKMESYQNYLFAEEAIDIARNCGASDIIQTTDGGVMAALWNLAERAGSGLAVDMRKIPVKQETIELCECYQLNPYQLGGVGTFLVATDKGEELVSRLAKIQMPAAVIGRLTDGNDRVLTSGTELRYLDKPSPDELVKIFAEHKEEKKEA